LIFPCQQRDNTNTQSYLVSFATWVRIYRHKVTLPVLLGKILEKESITSSLKKLNLPPPFIYIPKQTIYLYKIAGA